MTALALTNVLFLVGIGLLVGSLIDPLPTRPLRVSGAIALSVALFIMIAVTTMVI